MITESELRKIAKCADTLEDYLGKNSGTTKDWPIDIKCDNETDANKVTDLLNDLKEALKPYRRSK